MPGPTAIFKGTIDSGGTPPSDLKEMRAPLDREPRSSLVYGSFLDSREAGI